METKKSKPGSPKSETEIVYPPWIDLPKELTANILQRLGVVEILESAQKVCTTWRSVSKDPSIWRVIDMTNLADFMAYPYYLEKMCRHAVDRSQGQLIDISIDYFATDKLLHYIAQRSSHLKRLSLAHCKDDISGIFDGHEGCFTRAIQNFSELEELHINMMSVVCAEDVEVIGSSCPMLKSFTFNTIWPTEPYIDLEWEGMDIDEEARAIAENMPNLRHLSLIGNMMTNEGLQAILDGCPHLESLDLRRCICLDLGGDLGKRCSQQIKCLRRPSDSTRDYCWSADYMAEPVSDSPVRDTWLFGNFYS